MQPRGFLEKLYWGELDLNTFYSYRPLSNRSRVNPFINAYRQILRSYDPQEIEGRSAMPPEMLACMADAGLFGIGLPTTYGGQGLNLREYLKVVEEMARLDLCGALVSVAHLSIGVKGLLLFGNEAQKQKYLPQAASGKMIFSYALTEPKIGSDAKNIQTHAELSGDGTHYILNGQKTFITNANHAGALTVFAQLDRRKPGFLGAFIVETSWEGVKIGRDMPKMGLKASSTASIRLKNVRIPRQNLLGRPGDGFKIAMTILNYGRLGLAAASVGVMKQGWQDMLRRATTRIQFGEPIVRFELIQEKIARAKAHADAADAISTLTAGLLEEDPLHNVAIESSHCKLFSTTRAWDTVYEALQVAGGSGFLTTQPYEKRFRDFRVTTIFEGTTEIHSIYPALFLLRRIRKELQSLKGRPLSQLAHLWQLGRIKIQCPLYFVDRDLRMALRAVRWNVRVIRWMLLWAIVVFREQSERKEFFLRRLSLLSVTTYVLLALLAKARENLRSSAISNLDREVLRYLTAEAGRIRKEIIKRSRAREERCIAEISRELAQDDI